MNFFKKYILCHNYFFLLNLHIFKFKNFILINSFNGFLEISRMNKIDFKSGFFFRIF